LPHQSDNPDNPSTLPQPNLNPLLNPILAKNIGRWAEVYFTNPPEKRERAVQELVRELERESSIPDHAVAPQPSPRQRDLADNALASATAEVQAQGVICHSCGYLNRPKHKFCGRCGLRMASPTVDGPDEQESQPDSPVLLHIPEFPESPIFGLESTPRGQSYRLYAGVGLALVVLILGYMALRGTRTRSGAAHVTPPAPPAVTNPVASTPPPANSKADTSSQMPSAANKPAGSPARRTSASPAEAPAKTNPGDSHPPATVPTPGQNSPGTPSLVGDGSEELAMARGFLDGTNGRKQDPTQAVPWLWKAIAKQNVAATVLLSGMYLRGDGVPKNCEQARLLLDAATAKGRKDAAELLRNLQAFGCE